MKEQIGNITYIGEKPFKNIINHCMKYLNYYFLINSKICCMFKFEITGNIFMSTDFFSCSIYLLQKMMHLMETKLILCIHMYRHIKYNSTFNLFINSGNIF